MFLGGFRFPFCQVNKQDFLQVFQGSGIGKIDDNLRSADLLSHTTTILIPGRPGKHSVREISKFDDLK